MTTAERRPDRTFTRPAAAAVVLLLTAFVTWVFAHEGHAPLPTKGAQVDVEKGLIVLSREARQALDVQTGEAEVRPVADSLLAYATLTAPWKAHAFASSRLAGRVVRLHAHPGQKVRAGELLAEVEGVELESLQLEMLNAANDVGLSEKLVALIEPLARTGAVAEKGLIESQTKLVQNRNGLDVARAKWANLDLPAADADAVLKAGRSLPKLLPVRSPVVGTVVHSDLTVGRVVEPLEHLFEVIDLSTVWVRVGVLEQDLSKVAAGQAVELRLTAYPGEVFPTTIRVVGPHLDQQTHLNAAWAELTNPPAGEPKFLPGMAGEARLALPGRAEPLTVPADALLGDGAENFVLIEEAGAAGGSEYRRRNVVPGRKSAGRVEVRSGGLVPGDRVVTRGGHELAGLFVTGTLNPSPEAAQVMGLAVEPVRLQPVENVVEIDGAVDLPPAARASASSPTAGTLTRVLVDRGQSVRAGDAVAELSGLELQTLQLEMVRSHLESGLLDGTLRRLRGAVSVVARREVLELESRAAAARQQRDTARRKLLVFGLDAGQLDAVVTQKKLVGSVPVRSPIDGVVVSFDRVLGQAVRADEPLFAIHDLSRPLVQGYVSERDMGRVSVGQAARVRLAADPAYLATGKVVRSGRVFGAESRTLSVWVELDQPPTVPLRQGQLARIALTLSRPEPVPAVPLPALAAEGTQQFVFVRRPDGTFERRAVIIGRADDRFAHITSGLRIGDSVAIGGVRGLQTAFAVVR